MAFTPVSFVCYSKLLCEQGDQALENLFDARLKETADNITCNGIKVSPVFKTLKEPVKQAALSPSFICLLFENGRVCRIGYIVEDEAVESSSTENVSASSAKRSAPTPVTANRIATPATSRTSVRPNFENLTLSTQTEMIPQIAASGYNLSRSRILRAGRGRSAVLLGPRSIIPAHNVPEELIEQAQVVLQGKSRNSIIRELQRTNLDLNVAVNNLLGRDEEGEDEVEEESYAQDLISLLDVTNHGESASVILDAEPLFEEGDVSLRFANISRRVSSARGDSDRDRKRSARWYGPISHDDIYANAMEELRNECRQTEENLQHSMNSSSRTQKSSNTPPRSSVKYKETVEWFRLSQSDEDLHARFNMISALHSELLMVDNEGKLYQWRFDSDFGYTDEQDPTIHHPKSVQLKLANEVIVEIESCTIRATIRTLSSRIATLIDQSLGNLIIRKLEHQAMYIGNSENTTRIFTSQNFSVALCDDNQLFWWGILPKKLRLKLIEKAKSKLKQSGSNSNAIGVNSEVSLCSTSLIQPGTYGFIVKDGVPKTGQLLDNVLAMNSTYRFLIRSNISEPSDLIDITAFSDSQDSHLPPGSKRKHLDDESENTVSEENWHIDDVVFVEDQKTTPIGVVLLIDHGYALVRMNSHDENETNSSSIENSRIYRKDDLRLYKNGGGFKIPEFVLKNPKRLLIDIGNPLALSVDCEVLHCISMKDGIPVYYYVDLSISKIIKEFKLPFQLCDSSVHLSSSKLMKIHSITSSVPKTLIDLNRNLVLLTKNGTDSIKDPIWKNLMPFSSYTQIVTPIKPGDRFTSGQRLITFFTIKNLLLMPHILRSDIDGVVNFFQKYQTAKNPTDILNSVVNERCDGNRNILHAAVSICFPTSNKDIETNDKERTRFNSDPAKKLNHSLAEYIAPALSINSDHSYGSRTAQRSFENPSDAAENSWNPGYTESGCFLNSFQPVDHSSDYLWTPVKWDEKERQLRGIFILKLLLDSSFLKAHLPELLTHRSADKQTPFMYAVNGRAYHAALEIFEKVSSLVSVMPANSNFLNNAIFPPNSSPNDSPLYTLCCNDTCSFTWTGDEHINQDIYECRTCNLQGNLCCCTECARVCHKNHDCKLKVTSPTAYCDCWEVCKCKCIIAGDQNRRYELLCRILHETDFVLIPNSRNEPLLLFLVQTVSRQLQEQKQYKNRPRPRRVNPDSDQREDNLPPPNFSSRALERLLNEWRAIYSFVLFGESEDGQYQATQLDTFSLALLTKCPDGLLECLMKKFASELRTDFDADHITFVNRILKRFMRSLTRVTLMTLMTCAPAGRSANARRKIPATLVSKVKAAFKMAVTHVVHELADAAESLIAPVRFGLVKPGTKLNLGVEFKDCVQLLDESLSSFNTSLAVTNSDAEKHIVNLLNNTRTQDGYRTDNNSDSDFEVDFNVESDNESIQSESRENISSEPVVTQDSSHTPMSETDGNSIESSNDEQDSDAQSGVGGSVADDDEDVAAEVMSVTEDQSAAERTNQSRNSSTLTIPLRRDASINNGIPSSGSVRAPYIQTTSYCETSSMEMSAVLCRGFAIALRIISDLISTASESEAETLREYVRAKLKPVWNWLTSIMDFTEAQLRYGTMLSCEDSDGSVTHPLHSPYLRSIIEKALKQKKRDVKNENETSRREFVEYTLSLLRMQSNEHKDVFPYVDVLSLTNAAYVCDAILYFVLGSSMTESESPLPIRKNIFERETSNGHRHRFFKRSPSTLCIGFDAPDEIHTPVEVALPFAVNPQLLQPNSFREELFSSDFDLRIPSSINFKGGHFPDVSIRSDSKSQSSNDEIPTTAKAIFNRWRLSLEVFSRAFMDDVGSEPGSIIPSLGGFKLCETRFRQEMEKLKNCSTKEIRIENIERTRSSLITKLFRVLNTHFVKSYGSHSVSLFSVSKVNVSFKDEPGEGAGVARSFYTAVAEELVSNEKLPPFENYQAIRSKGQHLLILGSRQRREFRSLNVNARSYRPNEDQLSTTPLRVSEKLYSKILALNVPLAAKITGMLVESLPSSQLFRLQASDDELKLKVDEAMQLLSSTSRENEDNEPSKTIAENEEDDENIDCLPLFWKPGGKRFYAPRATKFTVNRISAYRNVGRLIGLCLLTNELLPIPLCRHVIKYLLSKPISWHDLAFFDHVLYESFRKVLSEAECNPDADFSSMQLNWVAELCDEEGGGVHELIKNGANIPVTAHSIHEFVRMYTEFRLVTAIEPFLKSLKDGIFDVIPHSSVENMTAEEFRLLLNGSEHVDIAVLASYTTFNDECGEDVPERIAQFKRWFWSVLEKMTSKVRQDLIYFWTGCPTLPSSEEGFQPTPSITIRHPDDQHLPTANTCISRLYVPLYSSKSILRSKLLYAIKAKNFGFV